ncbi:MAG: hypothetical protein K2X66_17715 [Cyanobacteria bacterium]|nr:hypothetical protein [Cyanobacteriota bacterium]
MTGIPGGFSPPNFNPQKFAQIRQDFQSAGIDPKGVIQQAVEANGGQINPDLIKQALNSKIDQVQDAGLKDRLKSDLAELPPPPTLSPDQMNLMRQRRQELQSAFAQYNLDPRQVMEQVKSKLGNQPPTGPDQIKQTLTEVLKGDGLNDSQISDLQSKLPPPPPFPGGPGGFAGRNFSA